MGSRCCWSSRGLLLLFSLAGLGLTTDAQNRLNGHGQSVTSLPMNEPGQPIDIDNGQGEVVTTTRSPPTVGIRPSLSPNRSSVMTSSPSQNQTVKSRSSPAGFFRTTPWLRYTAGFWTTRRPMTPDPGNPTTNYTTQDRADAGTTFLSSTSRFNYTIRSSVPSTHATPSIAPTTGTLPQPTTKHSNGSFATTTNLVTSSTIGTPAPTRWPTTERQNATTTLFGSVKTTTTEPTTSAPTVPTTSALTTSTTRAPTTATTWITPVKTTRPITTMTTPTLVATSQSSTARNHHPRTPPTTVVTNPVATKRTLRPTKVFPPRTTPTKPHLSTLRYTVPSMSPVTANTTYRIPAYVQLRFGTSWLNFCPESQDVQVSLTTYSHKVLKLPVYHRISVPYLNVNDYCRSVRLNRLKRDTVAAIPVEFYVALNGSYHENSTRTLGADLVSDPSALQERISFPILAAYMLTTDQLATPPPQLPGGGPGTIIGVTLTVCALALGMALSLIGVKVYRVRKSRSGIVDRYYFDGKQLQDALSESHQMGGVPPTGRLGAGRGPAPSYRGYFTASVNHGLVMDDEEAAVEVVAEMALPSHNLTVAALAKFYSYTEAIAEEYENLPGHQPSSPEIKKKIISKPRNHVCQSPERTKVPIATSPSPTKAESTIDANFIRGYDSTHCSYIAAKVGGADCSDAFWKMVWEQQSRTIVCLCSPYELGRVCPQYWPTKEGGPGAQLYGNILVTLNGGASGEHYFTSSLLVRNVEKTLCRPVTHYWFTNWMEGDVPSSPQAMMSMLLQVHNTHQESYGPVVIHCSDGVSRTGVVIATDINMQRLEESNTIDMPRTVSCIRQDRGHAILNTDQYQFIYKTLYEFSKFLSTTLKKETSDTESVALENEDEASSTGNEDGSSLATNSSRASSYLGDLSSSVKRKLAIKFPSLGVSAPTQPSPTRSVSSTSEFVVINSPKSPNLDMSVVSGLSDSEKGDRDSSNSSMQFRFDRTSFSVLSEDIHRTQGDNYERQRHSSMGQKPVRREPDRVFPRPVSSYDMRDGRGLAVGEHAADRGHVYEFIDIGNSRNFGNSFSLSSNQDVVEGGGPAKKHSACDASQSERLQDSLGSSNPFNIPEEQEHQPEIGGCDPPSSQTTHTRQPSYPGVMNPFAVPPPVSHQPPSGSARPSSVYLVSAHVPSPQQSSSSRPTSFPSSPQLSIKSDHSYPQENNPFDTPSGLDSASVQNTRSPASPNSAFVSVSHPDTAELLSRQGTYPKGINPFDDSVSLKGSLGRNSNPVAKGLRLMPTPFQKNKKEPTEVGNPFGEDWMDDAEESFT